MITYIGTPLPVRCNKLDIKLFSDRSHCPLKGLLILERKQKRKQHRFQMGSQRIQFNVQNEQLQT